jgi:hypothetical protein
MNLDPMSPPSAGDANPFPHVTIPERSETDRGKLARAAAVAVNGTKYEPLSRRGLHNIRIFVRVCTCGESHEFRTAGLRIAPCGQRLVIKARKARRAK